MVVSCAEIREPAGSVWDVPSQRPPARCAWCGAKLPEVKLGRPRTYCQQACRQRAYEQRNLAQRTGLPDDAVVVSRTELEHLQDRLFQIRCALEDAAAALADRAPESELRTVLRNTVDAAGELDRLWVTPREA